MDLLREEFLVTQARRDPSAFGPLFEEYYSPIFNYLLRRTADVELAADLTAEVFFKALENLGRFRWRNLPFSAWLYRIATNAVNGHFRKQKFRWSSLDEIADSRNYSGPGAEQEIEEAQERLGQYRQFLRVHKLLLQLPLRYQEVISLRFFENKKIGEIAAILGKREGTVKSLLSRGLQQLQQQFHDVSYENDSGADNPLMEESL
jgi:RNA polymerase sigma-70 factor, ECF subfamily